MTTDAGRIGTTGPRTGPQGAIRLTTALDEAGGTVTALLERVAGERIEAAVVAQATGRAGAGSVLGLQPSDPVLERAALLTGHETGRVFVYAESEIAIDRLSGDALRRLLECREPIGRILTEGGFEPERQFLDDTPGAATHPGAMAPFVNRVALARRSVILVGSLPVVLVSEWFLDTVVDALIGSGR